ncbi:hypothetical protein LTR66_011103 [Elasticomyces elasticus]|nr:hypothetical protein LTR66_011103 [Elasticomyces elasticus]
MLRAAKGQQGVFGYTLSAWSASMLLASRATPMSHRRPILSLGVGAVVGVAFCSLAGICSIAWLVMLILWVTRRNKTIQGNATAGPFDNRIYTMQPTQMALQQPRYPTMQSQIKLKPDFAVQGQPVEGMNVGGRYCGQCGSEASTPFCSKCGSRI